MAKRLRHHVNPLKAEYTALAAARVPLPVDGEVEVELGCADAQFLFARAAGHPRRTCVGVEIRRDLVADVNRRAAEAGLGNLSAVFANINRDLGGLFPDGRLDRVFLNFPDPWFKRRHHKRRVLTPAVAATVAGKLAPGGVVFFQSDVWELALDAMAVLEEASDAGLLENAGGPWSFVRANPWGARSLREERVEEKGMPVWRMCYRRPAARAGGAA
jgi:tRNA (guanine-N7-)-methyltransferase